MIWLIASLPFWLLGGALLAIGSWSLFSIGRHGLTIPERQHVFIGSIAFLILAGLMLLIAAKVAS